MNTFDIVNLKPSWFGISFLPHLIFHVKMKDFLFWVEPKRKMIKKSFTCNIYQNSKKMQELFKIAISNILANFVAEVIWIQ